MDFMDDITKGIKILQNSKNEDNIEVEETNTVTRKYKLKDINMQLQMLRDEKQMLKNQLNQINKQIQDLVDKKKAILEAASGKTTTP